MPRGYEIAYDYIYILCSLGHAYNIKYFSLIQIICKQIFLTQTTTQCQSGRDTPHSSELQNLSLTIKSDLILRTSIDMSSSSCRAASTDIPDTLSLSLSLSHSLATTPYRSSPLGGLQGYIPYPHRAAVRMFELAILLLLGHM